MFQLSVDDMRKMQFSVVIPAAGNSERMGRQKALLPYGNGFSFAEHLTVGFSNFGCNPVVIVVNQEFDSTTLHEENLIIVVNHHVEKGRSHSIHLGLQHIPEGVACFIHNIDNPFPLPRLLRKLLKAVPPEGYAMPVNQNIGGHPILLGRGVVDFLRNHTTPSDFRQILQRYTRVEVPCTDKKILWNINTPEEYQRFILSTHSKSG